MNEQNGISLATEKTVKINMYFIAIVCFLFGILNIIQKSYLVAVIIMILGIVVPVVTIVLKDRSTPALRGMILSQTQLVIVVFASTMKHELHGMFPLMVGSMCLSSVYYSPRILKVQWTLINIVSILGIFLNDLFYGGADTAYIIKGIMGMNVGCFMVDYLVRNSLKYMTNAQQAQDETSALLKKVNEQMNDTEELMESQKGIVAQIAEISGNLSSSAALMENIASSLSADSEEQEATISNITVDIASITDQAQTSLEESENASLSAEKSTEMLKANNAEVRNMVNAMGEISAASNEIEGIIKTIEDIAFQTNILALNAAVEAARAGEAGKGFAVVADEVRNLATKSAEAASSTSELIQKSIHAVEHGTDLAENVASRMNDVIRMSEESALQSQKIKGLTESQAESAEAVKNRMLQISQVVSQISVTAEKSADTARSVSNEVKRMNEIVKSFE